MKQKYSIFRENENGRLIIQEHAVLDKDIFSLLCEERYESRLIENAISQSPETLISAIRTPNMYPPNIYASRIAAAVAQLYTEDGGNFAELIFDDIENISKGEAPAPKGDDSADEDVEIDDLLEGDFEDDYDEKEIGALNSSIKIADDETLDIEDEA